MKIAIDLMGGDRAPHAVADGLKKFLSTNSDVTFIIYGTQDAKSSLSNSVLQRSEYVVVNDVISSSDKPSIAIRKSSSSMAMAIKAVKDGIADCCVSSGNTGALMAISKLYFKDMEGIKRPAITTLIPTKENKSILLDMGANIECDENNLFQFAVMGGAFAKVLFNIQNPTIALLNVGSEDIKGNQAVKKTAELLQNSNMKNNFVGYIEGNEINTGRVNVIVTDGFTGNVALKAIEGSGKLMRLFVTQAFKKSILSRIGYLFARSALKSTMEKMDYNNYNGAVFLGLNGIAIKSHGSANSKGFANAVNVAYVLAKNDILNKIKTEISGYNS